MYISLSTLFLSVLGIVGFIVLVYLIILIHKLTKLVSTLTHLVTRNYNNINKMCDKLPTISENIDDMCDNLKDVSNVITETTADVIVAKDNLFNNVEMIKEILNIIISVFIKK
ncbi:hypothetical protein [uncultured Clostridium sp.]|uniref:hypothetical protein n=1 Tax=uncultured Clostridium sp. TaxID=59620 RepID=UPI0025F409EE|nr:hypothetical protein [uncultured Clostridium sp.]